MPPLKHLFPLALMALSPAALADSEPASASDPMALAMLVAERPANEGRAGTMHFTLTSSSGRVREREALMVHSDIGETERIAIFFTAPAMIEETAFLSFNHDARDDENWLFLPVTDKVRRLPSSDRGDYFLGTDLTYGDIKDNFKFAPEDWTFGTDGTDTLAGETHPVLTGRSKTPEIGMEMGYSGFRALIDVETGFPVVIDYTDTDGEPLKRVQVLQTGQVGGAQTALHFMAENLQTGHHTEVRFSDMRHVPDLDQSIFDPDAMSYGVPDVG